MRHEAACSAQACTCAPAHTPHMRPIPHAHACAFRYWGQQAAKIAAQRVPKNVSHVDNPCSSTIGEPPQGGAPRPAEKDGLFYLQPLAVSTTTLELCGCASYPDECACLLTEQLSFQLTPDVLPLSQHPEYSLAAGLLHHAMQMPHCRGLAVAAPSPTPLSAAFAKDGNSAVFPCGLHLVAAVHSAYFTMPEGSVEPVLVLEHDVATPSQQLQLREQQMLKQQRLSEVQQQQPRQAAQAVVPCLPQSSMNPEDNLVARKPLQPRSGLLPPVALMSVGWGT